MRAIWTRLALGIATLALALASGSVSAEFSSITCDPSGDFVTGGGFIIPDPDTGNHANFGVAGVGRAYPMDGPLYFAIGGYTARLTLQIDRAPKLGHIA